MKLSNTIQRRIIYEELCQTKSHPTADELFQRVHARLPRISLATVYRNLSLMADSGLIRKIESSGARVRFDAVREPHFHLHCTKCGMIEDIPYDADLLSGWKMRAESGLSSRVESLNVEFYGQCRSCAKHSGEKTV